MNDDKPLILISNDDGYHAKGINTLVDMVSPLAHVIVCAPESARSGFGCAFSAATPLKLFHRRHRVVVRWHASGLCEIGFTRDCTA